MRTKRTYSAVILLLVVLFPAAARSGTGDGGATARAGAHRVRRLGGATPFTRPAESLRRTIHVQLRSMAAGRRARLRRRHGEAFATLPGGVSKATLDAIAACESGGDPTAVSADGRYRGKYQFDYGTWESVGGHGDPAAASAAEQDYRAAVLYARAGSSPWPLCG